MALPYYNSLEDKGDLSKEDMLIKDLERGHGKSSSEKVKGHFTNALEVHKSENNKYLFKAPLTWLL